MVAGPWFLLAVGCSRLSGISQDGMWGFPVSLLLPQPPQLLWERVKGGYRWLSGVCQSPWSVPRAGTSPTPAGLVRGWGHTLCEEKFEGSPCSWEPLAEDEGDGKPSGFCCPSPSQDPSTEELFYR